MRGWTRAANWIAAIFTLTMIALAPAFAQSGPGLPILLYHRMNPDAPGDMMITDATFREQLDWITQHQVKVVRLSQVVDALRGKGPPVAPPAAVLVADDGNKSVYTDLYPLILRYKFPLTLFIYPSAISNASYALTWEQIEEMMGSGLVDVQSHTYWHPNFNIERRRLKDAEYDAFVDMQLNKSKARLEEKLHIHVDELAWPFGIVNPDLEKRAAKAGYVAAYSLERKPVRMGEDMLSLPRYLIEDPDKGARFAALFPALTQAKVIP